MNVARRNEHTTEWVEYILIGDSSETEIIFVCKSIKSKHQIKSQEAAVTLRCVRSTTGHLPTSGDRECEN